jgi:hypothetical protein
LKKAGVAVSQIMADLGFERKQENGEQV